MAPLAALGSPYGLMPPNDRKGGDVSQDQTDNPPSEDASRAGNAGMTVSGIGHTIFSVGSGGNLNNAGAIGAGNTVTPPERRPWWRRLFGSGYRAGLIVGIILLILGSSIATFLVDPFSRSGDVPSAFIGTWSGSVDDTVNPTLSPYDVTLEIRQGESLVGASRYPGLGCINDLTILSGDQSNLNLIERRTAGATCYPEDRLELHIEDGSLRLTIYATASTHKNLKSGQVIASARLQRT